MSEAVADEQYRARGAVVKTNHPTDGTVEQVGPVWAGAGRSRAGVPTAGPRADRHTADLLAEAGYDEARVAALVAAGVIA